MSLRTVTLACLLLPFALTACGKKQPAEPTTSEPAAETAPAASSATAEAALQDEAARLAAEKKLAVERAIKEQALLEDPRGQWASSATASSTYASDKSPDTGAEYGPMKATGKPDVQHYGDDGNAWATETSDAGIEWIELGFAKPVNASEVRIRQSYAPGAIIKLELIDERGAKHTVWEGLDESVYEASQIAWLTRGFERSSYKAKGLRVTLASNAVPGWNEIDAVQLIGE